MQIIDDPRNGNLPPRASRVTKANITTTRSRCRSKTSALRSRAAASCPPFKHVFCDDDIAVYEDDSRAIKDKNPEPGDDQADDEAFYRKWRTWQISDHMPLWVKITTDFADDYLEKLAQ